jgi:hypothetical protein
MGSTVTRLGIWVAVALSAGTLGTAWADASISSRRAPSAVRIRVAVEVRRVFGQPSPDPQRRITVVLFPICVSTIDPRFAFVVANPVQRGGAVAQPGYFYLRREPSGNYKALDALLTARTSLRRPASVPRAVYNDFGIAKAPGTCSFQGAAAVKRALRQHDAPSFSW